jgi:hypothetical protein
MTSKEKLNEHEFFFSLFLFLFSTFNNDQSRDNNHLQKTVDLAIQRAQIQRFNDDVVFTRFNDQTIWHHCRSKIMNQRLCEHHSSFFEKQSFFVLFESNRDEEESCSNMHVRHQTYFHWWSEISVSLEKRNDYSDSFARESLSASS